MKFSIPDQRIFFSVLLVLAVGFSSPTLAEEEGEAELVQYIDMQPSFVLNYGEPAQRRLKYVKADLSLRVDTRPAAAAVEHHMPALRNIIVLLFSRQSVETMNDNAKREELRQQAMAEIKAFLKEEEGEQGEEMVKDLFFTNFVTQG